MAVNLPNKHYKPRLSRHGRRHMFQVYHQGIVAVQQNIETLHQAAPSIGPMGRLADFRCPRGRSEFPVKLVSVSWGGKKSHVSMGIEGNFAGFFFTSFCRSFFSKKRCFDTFQVCPGKHPKKMAPCPLTKRNRAKSQSHWSLDKSILLYKAGILPDVNRILPYLGNAAQRLRFS